VGWAGKVRPAGVGAVPESGFSDFVCGRRTGDVPLPAARCPLPAARGRVRAPGRRPAVGCVGRRSGRTEGARVRRGCTARGPTTR